jgi:hypothetical protein
MIRALFAAPLLLVSAGCVYYADPAAPPPPGVYVAPPPATVYVAPQPRRCWVPGRVNRYGYYRPGYYVAC